MRREQHATRTLRRGFTLIEIVAASIIISMLAAATGLVIFRMARTQRGVLAQEAFARADYAAQLIAKDVLTARREQNLTFGKVQIVHGGSAVAESARDELIVLSLAGRRIRANPANNEGPVHEVQYRVAASNGAEGSAAGANTSDAARDASSLSLLRRADPNPDDYLDAGGVVSVAVPGVVALRIVASDGISWFDDWDSDLDGYPHAVRITVTAASPDGLTVRTARRTVALDRTPVPVTPPETENEATSQRSPTAAIR